MLKIKAERMNDLEKFGFEECKYRFFRDTTLNNWVVIVEKDTRIIKVWNFAYGGCKKDIIPYIQDLIEADMVDKLEN